MSTAPHTSTPLPCGRPGGRGASVDYGGQSDTPWPTTAAGGLASGLAGGVPLEMLLRTAAEECGGSGGAALREMAERVERGVPLPEALENTSIPPMYTDLLRIAQGGVPSQAALHDTLTQWTEQREASHRVRETFWYLALILVASMQLLAGVIWVCVPRMKGIFEGFGVELPALTRVMLWVGDVLAVWWPLLEAVLLGVVGGFWWASVNEHARRGLANLFASIPPFHLIVRRSGELRFLHGLAVRIESAQPLPHAIVEAGMASGLNVVMQRATLTASRIEKGTAPENAFDAPGVWPALFAIPFLWGKTNAEIADGLRMVAALHRQRLLQAPLAIVAFVEPLFMLGIGFVVMTIVFAMFMPLIKLLNDLS